MEAADRDLVVSVVAQHADALLRTARRYTACAADAEDAYQRALEIFVKSAHRLDADGAHKWLHVVVRNEALSVRRSRSTLVGVEDEAALDALDDGRHVASVEERSERLDDLGRAAEALQRLKPQEVTALWLKAEGLSYDEIAERQGWSYTKVNRCITEGRRAFLRRYAGIQTGEECERWSPILSAIADGEASPRELLEARPHLRNCPACRSSLAAMRSGGAAVAVLFPPAAAGAAPASGAPASVAASLHDRVAALAGSLHERLAATATSLHDRAAAALPAAPLGRGAAVAASVAALAGGGVVVQQSVGGAGDARADAAQPPAVATPGGAAPAAASARAAAEPTQGPSTPQPSARERPSVHTRAAGDGARDADRVPPPADAAFAPEAAKGPEPTAPRAPPQAAAPRASTGGGAADAAATDVPAEPGAEFGLLEAPRRP